MYKKLNRKAKERLSETEVLGETMTAAATTMGVLTPYGASIHHRSFAHPALVLWSD